jgi:hypothetical protein
MSVDKYVKFISEQQKSIVSVGFAEEIESPEIALEDYVDMLHLYIEDLESQFEAEDLQQIQELSKSTLRSYVDKRAGQRDLASRDTDKETMMRKKLATARGIKPNNKPFNPASASSYHRAVNKITSDKDSPNRPKVLGTN